MTFGKIGARKMMTGKYDDWHKPDDWPDIEAILKQDVTPQAAIDAGATNKWIMLCKPGLPGNNATGYTFTNGTAVYFRVSDGRTTVEHAASTSLYVEPLDNGVPFWIIVYTNGTTTRTPSPYFTPYTTVGPFWVHAPDHVFEDRSHNTQSWLALRRFCAKEIVCYTYDAFFMGCSRLESVKLENGMSAGGTNAFTQSMTGVGKITRLPKMNITSTVTNIHNLLSGCSGLLSVDVSGWDISNVTRKDGLFQSCSTLQSLDLPGFVTSKDTSLYSFFYNCTCLRSVNMSGWDTTNVTTMQGMFRSCRSIGPSISFPSGFVTSKVTSMKEMFNDCSVLVSLDLTSFDTSSVTAFDGIFQNCTMLESVDISTWDCSAMTSADNIFVGDTKLATIIGSKTVASDGSVEGSTAYFGKGPKVSFKVDNSPLLGHDSLLYLMYWVPSASGQTMTLGATNKAKLTAAEIAVAEAKGWTVA